MVDNHFYSSLRFYLNSICNLNKAVCRVFFGNMRMCATDFASYVRLTPFLFFVFVTFEAAVV